MDGVVAPGKSLRILGIDPGTHVCGWGVISRDGSRLVAEGFGVVKAPSSAPIEERLRVIARGLREIVAAHRPDEASLEEVFYGRDVRAAVRIGEGRGAALVVLAEAGIPVTGYANNVVKRAVAGAGRAGKESVRAMVKVALGLATIDGPLDASDALALAICHHHQRSVPRASTGSSAGAASPGRLAPRVQAALDALRTKEKARAPRRPRA